MSQAGRPYSIVEFSSMRMRDSTRVLPGMNDVIDDFRDTDSILDLRENKRAIAAHLFCVTLHHLQVGSHCLGQICFVDHEQVGLCNPRAAFARNLITARDINDLNGVVSQLAAEAGGEVITARLDEQNCRVKLAVEFFQREKVRRYVFADRGMRAATCLDGANTLGFERIMTREKFAIFLRENVVGHGGDVHLLPQRSTELEHQRCLAAAHRATHSDGKCALLKIAVQRQIALMEMTWMIMMFVRVTVIVRMMSVWGHSKILNPEHYEIIEPRFNHQL
jgi:hypothetical protein